MKISHNIMRFFNLINKSQPITNAIFHCRFRSDNKALSPQSRRTSGAVRHDRKAARNRQRKHSAPLCGILKKAQRTVKHIWFLPTHKAKPEKPKELVFHTAEKRELH
jgi:hypothetical protein